MRLCPILGLPGAGKTTLAIELVSANSFVRVSAGDWLRERMRTGDVSVREQLSLNAAMDRTLFQEFLNESVAPYAKFPGSIVIDGSPRIKSQVEWLSESLQSWVDVRVVGIHLTTPPELALQRLTARPPRYGDSEIIPHAERISREEASLRATLNEFSDHWPLLTVEASCGSLEICGRVQELLAHF